MVKIRMATYFPRLLVGAISDVTARAVSSLIPGTGAIRKKLCRKMTLTPTCPDPGKDHSADELIHVVRCRADNHPHHEETSPNQGDISSTHQIRKGSDKGANGRERQEVGQDIPYPSIDAANVTVDVGRHGAEEVDGDLRAGPEERHGDETHHSGEGHTRLRIVGFFIAVGSKASLLVVVGVAGDSLVGVDLFDV